MSGSDINPEFYVLLNRAKDIQSTLQELKRKPDKINWPEINVLSDQLGHIADQMESMLPPTTAKPRGFSDLVFAT